MSPVDYLLISTPNLLIAGRIRVQLEAAGVRTETSDLGLEVWCGTTDWRLVAESIGVVLSPLERHDTRVATVSMGRDPSALHRAIFRAKSLEELMNEVRESWLDEVLAAGRIAMHFQPMVQYPPGRIHGYECLMRGVDEAGNLIAPARMFEAAATLDKVRELDEQCRMEALRACATLGEPNLMFFINFIPSAIVDPERFLSSLNWELGRSGLRPQQIVFEVVETDRVHDQRHLLGILKRSRKAGFQVALDDVGAGYSSLLSLSRLRPDYIKLDGELVRRAGSSAMEAKMIADLAEAARQNGIITIAEGIETEQQLKLVMDCGIRLTQGYVHSRPQPVLLEANNQRGMLERLSAIACG